MWHLWLLSHHRHISETIKLDLLEKVELTWSFIAPRARGDCQVGEFLVESGIAIIHWCHLTELLCTCDVEEAEFRHQSSHLVKIFFHQIASIHICRPYTSFRFSDEHQCL